ncbi:MAG: hypothetical protein RJA07_2447 [Bacteroidota bacterium]|jgi:dolichol-phosphate mannosyltransferase
MELSVVIPIFNEEEIIDQLISETVSAIEKITPDYEIILVDDGSKDSSVSKILANRKNNSKVKLVMLSRNFGHQSAYTAGLAHAKGNYIAMMDGDLQDPPAVIEPMYLKCKNEDFDVVYGKRTERNESFNKKMSIKLFHIIFNKISKINAPSNVGNFSVMNKIALEALLAQTEKTRYLPGLRFFIGFNQGFVDYERPDRAAGEAKMNFSKLFSLAFNAIFSFSDFPIKLCIYAGLFGVISFMVVLAISIVHKMMGIASPGWMSTLSSIYFFGSVQLVFLGIIGEYVYRIYIETQNRSIFIVKKYFCE